MKTKQILTAGAIALSMILTDVLLHRQEQKTQRLQK